MINTFPGSQFLHIFQNNLFSAYNFNGGSRCSMVNESFLVPKKTVCSVQRSTYFFVLVNYNHNLFTMKQNKYLYLAAITTILFFAFVSNSIAQEETRKVSGFNSVSYSLPGDLTIVQGNNESLTLYGDKDDLERIVTRVEGNTLKIYTKNNSNGLGSVSCKLSLKNLDELAIAGSGNVVINGDLRTGNLEVALSGSGSLKAKSITADDIELSLAGSGNVLLGGKLASDFELSSAGSGNVDASALQAKDVEVSLAGSGNAKVWAEDNLDVSIVGSGSVEYKGKPLVDSSVSGSGSTRPL